MLPRATTLVRLAVRNLRRYARRTALTAAAMIVGGALLIFSLSIADGGHEDWIESGARLGSGHIALQAPGFQMTRKIEDRLPAAVRRAAERALEAPAIAEHVQTAAPQLAIDGLASSPDGARPAAIVGVDPAAESRFSILDDKRVEGRYLEPDDRLAAYVGATLVESLDLRLGSRLVLTAQTADGEIAGQLVRVVGIFRSGVPEIDGSLIHIPIGTASSWLRVDDDVTRIAILLDRSRAVGPVVNELRRRLADPIEADQLTVLSWREASPQLDAAVRIDDLGNYVWQVIMFSIIALAIVNTVLMSVMYRKREFGLLQALGYTPGQTGGLVITEGLILTALSGFVGIAIGLFVTWFFWRDGLDFSFTWGEDWTFSGIVIDPVIVPMFSIRRIVQSLIFILFIGTIASLYPAYRATRIDVAEAMKFER
ncbi:MAG: ABC transporter permease [Gemmatimonadetes bacterium]|uniref:ABC transporter permease n=1 Tax=Candidatus Kutchimonas denitrificans TaxID=3056748 RepID=A0AAE5C9Z6_9BACT|nr:ABC transporter permease [Gemmatimonadota bacterium]NIR73982.1 ABC transporter permease [Candidatus Kutchimonas denitrificans]NIS02971.1 ABC transporter permease [Gemmatimonadota bacterium]NIT68688.1 ABC transporter permease [Gemmatimonadota bacterium]NIU53269.1 FtsX-like permease family protein [Gemmatimonadota bacterium]